MDSLGVREMDALIPLSMKWRGIHSEWEQRGRGSKT
jgi:hypothetical protein